MEARIAVIRKLYQHTQKRLPGLTHDERTLCTDPEQHWTCSAFQAWLDEGRIVKLAYGGGEEGFWSSTELFLDDRGEIYFAFGVLEDGREDPSKLDESRTYLQDGVVIRQLCRSGTSEDIQDIPQEPCPEPNPEIWRSELERYRTDSGNR